MAAQGTQTQPPPEVDQALRSRIQLFYQAHVDGKTRRAEEVVAEDSKDIFFDMPKPRYYNFEIRGIKYSDNFTKAEATVGCEDDLMIMGMQKPVRVPLTRITHWKLDKGQWWWYVDPNASRESPFGTMAAGKREDGPAAPPALPKGPSAEELLKLVKSDKNAIALSNSKTSSETVVVTNEMPGWVKLRVQAPPVAGLEAALDRDTLNQNQQAALTVRYTPKKKVAAPEATIINVMVEPTGAILPIRVTFGAPKAGASR